MSRSRNRRYYEDYEDEEYYEQFKNRRNKKLKKVYDRESFDHEEENADLHLPK